MCDRCNKQGLVALEAIANGEEIPELPQDAEEDIVRMNVHMPFPLIAQISDDDVVAIATNRDGWRAITGFLEALGRPCGPECHHE